MMPAARANRPSAEARARRCTRVVTITATRTVLASHDATRRCGHVRLRRASLFRMGHTPQPRSVTTAQPIQSISGRGRARPRTASRDAGSGCRGSRRHRAARAEAPRADSIRLPTPIKALVAPDRRVDAVSIPEPVLRRPDRDDGRLWFSGNRFGGAAILLSSTIYLLVAQWLPHHSTA